MNTPRWFSKYLHFPEADRMSVSKQLILIQSMTDGCFMSVTQGTRGQAKKLPTKNVNDVKSGKRKGSNRTDLHGVAEG